MEIPCARIRVSLPVSRYPAAFFSLRVRFFSFLSANAVPRSNEKHDLKKLSLPRAIWRSRRRAEKYHLDGRHDGNRNGAAFLFCFSRGGEKQVLGTKTARPTGFCSPCDSRHRPRHCLFLGFFENRLSADLRHGVGHFDRFHCELSFLWQPRHERFAVADSQGARRGRLCERRPPLAHALARFS